MKDSYAWQPDLAFTQDELEMFKAMLSDGRWHTMRELGVRTEGERRKYRYMAEHSDGEIISGNLGYKLHAAATYQESVEFEARWMSQIKKMMRRIQEARKARQRHNLAEKVA
ncbi:MAG: hypothetical protein ABQ298_03605 [Puniceicoccaceae bacterium]